MCLLQSRASRASIRRHSNANNVPFFVAVIESCYSDFQHKIGRGSYCSSSSRSGCRSSGAQRIDWLTLWRKICTQLLWGFSCLSQSDMMDELLALVREKQKEKERQKERDKEREVEKEKEKEKEEEMEAVLYVNCLLLGLDPYILASGGGGGVISNGSRLRAGLFRHPNPRLGEALLHFLLCALRGPYLSSKVCNLFLSSLCISVLLSFSLLSFYSVGEEGFWVSENSWILSQNSNNIVPVESHCLRLKSLFFPQDFAGLWPIFDAAQSRDFRKVKQSSSSHGLAAFFTYSYSLAVLNAIGTSSSSSPSSSYCFWTAVCFWICIQSSWGLLRNLFLKASEELNAAARRPTWTRKDRFMSLWPLLLQIVQGLINELEAQGALPRSNSRVSSLATCCGQRYECAILISSLEQHAFSESSLWRGRTSWSTRYST